MTVRATNDEVIAFRLRAHHLDERLDPKELIKAVGASGIQNSPPGSALTALHARVMSMSAARLDSAVADEKVLLQSWCMRAAPYFFPTSDLSVFTTGVLPTTEAAKRHFVLGVEQSLDKLGMDLTDLVSLVRDQIAEVLDGNPMAIGELGRSLADRVVGFLTDTQKAVWQSEGPYAKGQSLGEGVIHFCVRILTLEQVLCFAPREDNTAPFVLLEKWLEDSSGPPPVASSPQEPAAARAELLRRYLRCYGPSTRADFASWLGIRSTEAEPWWEAIGEEVVEVDFGRRTWMLGTDLESLKSATMPRGVRLLPPRDAYTQMRDRQILVEDRYRSAVWKTVGDPGAVLVDGRIVGTWRARKKGTKLRVVISMFKTASASVRSDLAVEAEAIGSLRAAPDVDVDFETVSGSR